MRRTMVVMPGIPHLHAKGRASKKCERILGAICL
jgi:hypothetical protein